MVPGNIGCRPNNGTGVECSNAIHLRPVGAEVVDLDGTFVGTRIEDVTRLVDDNLNDGILLGEGCVDKRRDQKGE